MKIYTRNGDEGSTSLLSGERVSKASLRMEATGMLDELNSALGLARAFQPAPPVEELLEHVQNQLFHAGADLAMTAESKREAFRLDEAEIRFLEQNIDRMTEQLPPLVNFILPGGSMAGAQIHVGRTLCRRAERSLVLLNETEKISPILIVYLNRLSDFLFTLARWENFLKGQSETKWSLK